VAKKRKGYVREAEEQISAEPITLLILSHALGDREERARIRDINRVAVDLACVRLRGGPLASLIDRKRIGPAEVMAAQDIDKAFTALTIGIGFKPIVLERRDRGGDTHWPAATIDAVRRFQAWSGFWSDRKKRGDKSLPICIAAVVDERSLSGIEDDEGVRNGTAGKVVARMLRDYAARAGWVTGHLALQWKAEAEMSFRLDPLTVAVRRHASLRAAEATT
jgi:hypothetical protein